MLNREANSIGRAIALPPILLLLGAGPNAPPRKFDPGCTLPPQIAPAKDAFADCGNCGVASVHATRPEAAAKSAESKGKNNFCGAMDAITVVDFDVLTRMQAQTNKNNLGTNRQNLRQVISVGGHTIGEGSVVRIKAFVKEAHIADCDGGEEVNCKMTGNTKNDIHIPLVDPAKNPRTEDECASVTAEMSPHFRPAAWADFDMKTPLNNPVRVTGQLFFDNSHDPCEKNSDGSFKREKPARISLWEIHPVYAMEVCTHTDPQQCDIANDGVWSAYDEWVARPESVTEPTGRTSRDECLKLNGKPSKPVEATRPLQCAATTQSARSSRARRQ